MKIKNIYKITLVSLIAIIFIFSDCTGKFGKAFYHDKINPCTLDSNSIECKNWEKKYPKEYKRYQKRNSEIPKTN